MEWTDTGFNTYKPHNFNVQALHLPKEKETTGPTFFDLKVYIKNMETIERKNWIFITRNGTS